MSNSNIFYALNPTTNENLKKSFMVASESEINEKVEQANRAFDVYRKKDKDSIANFLDKVADEIMLLGDASLEEHLGVKPRARILAAATASDDHFRSCRVASQPPKN